MVLPIRRLHRGKSNMRIQVSSGFPWPLHHRVLPVLHLGAFSWLHMADPTGRKDKHSVNSQCVILLQCVRHRAMENRGTEGEYQQVPTKESWRRNINMRVTLISVISLLHVTNISTRPAAPLLSLWYSLWGAVLAFCLFSNSLIGKLKVLLFCFWVKESSIHLV